MVVGHPSRALFLSLALAALAIAPATSAAPPPGSVGDMYVTGDVSNSVRVYTGVSGSFLGYFNNNTNNQPLGIHFHPTNGRMLVGGFSNGVREYDSATGVLIKTYGPVLWQWSGIYRANGNVLVASSATNQILEYDGTTGAFVQLFAPLPGSPSDMEYGPNGNLYVCQLVPPMVWELDPSNGNVISAWNLPANAQPNDVAFLNGEILVSAMFTNLVYRYDSTPVHNLLGTFGDANWGNTHGIAISPHNGHIYVVDGVTAQVYEFDPLTFALLDPAVLTPGPGDKVVDIAFRPSGGPTPAAPSTWGRIKALYR